MFSKFEKLKCNNELLGSFMFFTTACVHIWKDLLSSSIIIILSEFLGKSPEHLNVLKVKIYVILILEFEKNLCTIFLKSILVFVKKIKKIKLQL